MMLLKGIEIIYLNNKFTTINVQRYNTNPLLLF